jgi:hypothetical protein
VLSVTQSARPKRVRVRQAASGTRTKVQHEHPADEDAHADVQEGEVGQGTKGQHMEHAGLHQLNEPSASHHKYDAPQENKGQGLDDVPVQNSDTVTQWHSDTAEAHTEVTTERLRDGGRQLLEQLQEAQEMQGTLKRAACRSTPRPTTWFQN